MTTFVHCGGIPINVPAGSHLINLIIDGTEMRAYLDGALIGKRTLDDIRRSSAKGDQT